MSSTARWRSASEWATFSASGRGYPASISTWSRHDSTFSRSDWGFSRVWGMVDAISSCSRRSLPAEVGGHTEPLRPRCELVHTSCQIVQAGVQNGPLRLGVGRDLVQPLAETGLHMMGAVLER